MVSIPYLPLVFRGANILSLSNVAKNKFFVDLQTLLRLLWKSKYFQDKIFPLEIFRLYVTSSCKCTIVICYMSDHTSTLSPQRHNEVIAPIPEIIHCYECSFCKPFPFHTKPQVGWSQLVLLIKIKTICECLNCLTTLCKQHGFMLLITHGVQYREYNTSCNFMRNA